MSRKANVRQSAYGDYVTGKALALLSGEGASFTMKELADFAGLKVTPSFRRRVWTMEHEGKIVAHPYIGEDGRMRVFYCVPFSEPSDQELPF
jgi:hypothetical protein